MKRVYFAGSIRGGREDLALYAALIARLRERSEVLTEFNVFNQEQRSMFLRLQIPIMF